MSCEHIFASGLQQMRVDGGLKTKTKTTTKLELHGCVPDRGDHVPIVRFSCFPLAEQC